MALRRLPSWVDNNAAIERMADYLLSHWSQGYRIRSKDRGRLESLIDTYLRGRTSQSPRDIVALITQQANAPALQTNMEASAVSALIEEAAVVEQSLAVGVGAFTVPSVLAASWASQNALNLAQYLTQMQERTITSMLVSALNGTNPMNGRTLAPLILQSVDLTPQQSAWVLNRYLRLTASGRPPSVVQSMVDTFAKQLRMNRSRTIARTEINRALISGRMAAWKQAAESGYTSDVRKRWLVAPGCCDICSTMADKEVGIDDEFDTPWGKIETPRDSHPNCRCTAVIITGVLDIDVLAGLKQGPLEVGKGDLPNHRFRGNQYTGGIPGGAMPDMNGVDVGSKALIHILRGRYEASPTHAPLLDAKRSIMLRNAHYAPDDGRSTMLNYVLERRLDRNGVATPSVLVNDTSVSPFLDHRGAMVTKHLNAEAAAFDMMKSATARRAAVEYFKVFCPKDLEIDERGNTVTRNTGISLNASAVFGGQPILASTRQDIGPAKSVLAFEVVQEDGTVEHYPYGHSDTGPLPPKVLDTAAREYAASIGARNQHDFELLACYAFAESQQREWAASAISPAAVAMKVAVAKMARAGTDWKSRVGTDSRIDGFRRYKEFRSAYDAYVRSVYRRTQDVLSQAGIKEVQVDRGMTLDISPFAMSQHALDGHDFVRALNWPTADKMLNDKGERASSGDTVYSGTPLIRALSDPISSWAADPWGINTFKQPGESHVGVHMTAIVPSTSVWSMAETGPGCTNEFEVLLAHMDGAIVRAQGDAEFSDIDRFKRDEARRRREAAMNKADEPIEFNIDFPDEGGVDWIKRMGDIAYDETLTKGDRAGHQFHGNQWTGGIGGYSPEVLQQLSRKALSPWEKGGDKYYKWTEPARRATQEMYSAMFTLHGQGWSSRVDEVELAGPLRMSEKKKDYKGPHTYGRVTGSIVDDTGKVIGYFSRLIETSTTGGVMHNSVLEIAPESRGKGIGGEFVVRTMARARDAGIGTTMVYAHSGRMQSNLPGNETNTTHGTGVYTWAAMGFEVAQQSGNPNITRSMILADKDKYSSEYMDVTMVGDNNSLPPTSEIDAAFANHQKVKVHKGLAPLDVIVSLALQWVEPEMSSVNKGDREGHKFHGNQWTGGIGGGGQPKPSTRKRPFPSQATLERKYGKTTSEIVASIQRIMPWAKVTGFEEPVGALDHGISGFKGDFSVGTLLGVAYALDRCVKKYPKQAKCVRHITGSYNSAMTGSCPAEDAAAWTYTEFASKQQPGDLRNSVKFATDVTAELNVYGLRNYVNGMRWYGFSTENAARTAAHEFGHLVHAYRVAEVSPGLPESQQYRSIMRKDPYLHTAVMKDIKEHPGFYSNVNTTELAAEEFSLDLFGAKGGVDPKTGVIRDVHSSFHDGVMDYLVGGSKKLHPMYSHVDKGDEDDTVIPFGNGIAFVDRFLHLAEPLNAFAKAALAKGDLPGHKFRGNQHTGGIPEFGRSAGESFGPTGERDVVDAVTRWSLDPRSFRIGAESIMDAGPGQHVSGASPVVALLRAVHDAAPVPSTLWRGASAGEEAQRELQGMKVGATVDVPLWGASRSKNEAVGHFHGGRPGGVLFQIDGAVGVPVNEYSKISQYAYEDEWITGGRYKVLSVEQVPALLPHLRPGSLLAEHFNVPEPPVGVGPDTPITIVHLQQVAKFNPDLSPSQNGAPSTPIVDQYPRPETPPKRSVWRRLTGR